LDRFGDARSDYLRGHEDTTDFWEIFVVDPSKPIGTRQLSMLRTPRGIAIADVMSANDADPGRHGPGRVALRFRNTR
jgi:hypothetical protein